jgi:hypothetical protein
MIEAKGEGLTAEEQKALTDFTNNIGYAPV